MSSERKIPTPVGGVPIERDFAPSIVFAVAFSLLFPFIVLRFAIPSRRTIIGFGTMTFAIERIVVYAFRATQAHNAAKRTWPGLLIYLQMSFAQGYVGIASDAVPLLRLSLSTLQTGKVDHKRTRFLTRLFIDQFGLLYIVPLALNIVQGTRYKAALDNQKIADGVFAFRYAASALALLATFLTLVWLLLAYRRMPDMKKPAAHRLMFILTILMIPSIYRLSVMYNTIPELMWMGDGSLQSPAAKAQFYVLLCLPEWVAAALVIVPNTRQDFETGPFGDWRSFDGQKSVFQSRKANEEQREQARREYELNQLHWQQQQQQQQQPPPAPQQTV
ncbi:hypothetical protein BKA62DRAFT_741186 [Auriculariales sp. MPI-PUGE-AT-0066]|nr:hypothetical protein BKA62DRAFT_741186 [Auriculariales sp. MPI-PUGE-AT-0066]